MKCRDRTFSAALGLVAGVAVAFGSSVKATGKPLKVYILAGQSNMEGHADVWWIDKPFYRSIMLTDAETQHLKQGVNVLAVYANDMVDKDSTERYGAIDLR